MHEPRPAATVVLLREGESGPETLLLCRSSRVGFFPRAWVFPGGRVDEADRLLPARGAEALPEEGRAAALAAVRECFEEAGIWLGAGDPGPELRARLNAGELRLHELAGLEADLHRLRPWARWVTPVAESRRYDTWFYLAVVGPGTEATPDEGEATQSAWVRPTDALARPEDYPMAPPTFRTLEELAELGSLEAILASLPARRLDPLCPRLEQNAEGGWEIVLPGDPTYPAERPVEGPTRIAFRQGRWWSHRPA